MEEDQITVAAEAELLTVDEGEAAIVLDVGEGDQVTTIMGPIV